MLEGQPSKTTLDRTRTVTTYLLREPVKEAVRDAIREEVSSVEPASEATTAAETPAIGEQSESEGESSRLPLVLALVVAGGVVYLLRRRRGSDDPQQSAYRDPGVESDTSTGAEDIDSSVTQVSD